MPEQSQTIFTDAVLRKRLILLLSPSEVSFSLVEKIVDRIPNTEFRWHSNIIEALADIFMSKPDLLIVFGDSNHESLEFVQLVRNNPDFQNLSIYTILPEPLNFRQRFLGHLKITETFSTPIDSVRFHTQAMLLLKPQGEKGA